jgi:DNA-directed RNA polymerase subunit RPC12/RpoP
MAELNIIELTAAIDCGCGERMLTDDFHDIYKCSRCKKQYVVKIKFEEFSVKEVEDAKVV